PRHRPSCPWLCRPQRSRRWTPEPGLSRYPYRTSDGHQRSTETGGSACQTCKPFSDPPFSECRSVMQELHDAVLLQELGARERRSASVGVVLLVVVAHGSVETFSVVESGADRVAMEEVALLRAGPHARKIGVEDPVEARPTHHAASRTREELHLHVVDLRRLGELHDVAAHRRGGDSVHLVLFLDRHLVLPKGRHRLGSDRQRERGG